MVESTPVAVPLRATWRWLVLLALAIGRGVGILEVSILAVGLGVYWVCKLYMPGQQSLGAALIAGGLLSIGIQMAELLRRGGPE